jgi:hypothetical protein
MLPTMTFKKLYSILIQNELIEIDDFLKYVAYFLTYYAVEFIKRRMKIKLVAEAVHFYGHFEQEQTKKNKFRVDLKNVKRDNLSIFLIGK